MLGLCQRFLYCYFVDHAPSNSLFFFSFCDAHGILSRVVNALDQSFGQLIDDS